MSALHTILPLDAACAEWLAGEGVSHPASTVTSRFPTPGEITAVLHHLPGFTASIDADAATGEWSAHVDPSDRANPAWAFLRVSNYSSDDQPHEFYFPKGWPAVILTIVERLTHQCGPLVIVDDSGSTPVVVYPSASIEALLQQPET